MSLKLLSVSRNNLAFIRITDVFHTHASFSSMFKLLVKLYMLVMILIQKI